MMRARILTLAVAAFATVLLVAGSLASGKAKPDRQGSSAKSKLESRALFAVLNGRNEVDAAGRKGAGDPDGRGSFTATVDGGQLCFGITVTNLDAPVAAHIHKAGPNQSGPIVVPLMPPAAGDPGASSGCVNADPAITQAILKHPHRYYANVHTGPFPAGAVRGQLFRRSNHS